VAVGVGVGDGVAGCDVGAVGDGDGFGRFVCFGFGGVGLPTFGGWTNGPSTLTSVP
jgi:hypothetical protein